MAFQDLWIPKVQKIEKDTGLKLALIVLSGDFHHMAMKNWLDAQPYVATRMVTLATATREGDFSSTTGT
jgi:hypothetical protein